MDSRKPASGLPGVFLAIFLALGCSGISSAAGRLSNDLQNVEPGKSLDVVVQFKNLPAAADLNAIRQQGGILKKAFGNIRGAVFTLTGSILNTVAQHPNITYMSPDRKLAGKLEFAEPTVGANIAFQNGWTGAGVAVAVIDSGIQGDHPDLKGRVVYAENFAPGEFDASDRYGHGTHVAGIVGGDGTASTGRAYYYTFRGIAPRVTLVNLRALDSNGQGTDSSVISAIDRAISLKDVYGIKVINLSLGRAIQDAYADDPLCQAVQRAWQAGLVVVVAAGNNGRDNSMGTSGYGTITSPGNSPYVITVGSMKDMGTPSKTDDLIASYSSKGPTLLDHVVKPDILAPGNSIVSALASSSYLVQQYPSNIVPISYFKNGETGNASPYFRLSGTSMATPMVSGAAALLLQKDPSLTPDQIKARLMKTATKQFPTSSTEQDSAGVTYTSVYDLFTVGAGYLDVQAAMSNNDSMSGNALSPVANFDANLGTASLVLSPGSVWNNTVVWGTTVVWGSTVVWGTAVIQPATVVWGTNSTSGFTVVWGTTVVWGSSQPFSEAVSVRGDR